MFCHYSGSFFLYFLLIYYIISQKQSYITDDLLIGPEQILTENMSKARRLPSCRHFTWRIVLTTVIDIHDPAVF